MGLGHKKGHVHGKNVSGGHSTLIDAADDVIKKIDKMWWFQEVRPGEISFARGGKPSVTVRRHPDPTYKDTLKLIFRQSVAAQDVYIHVDGLGANLTTIVGDIRRIVEKALRGAEFYDRTIGEMRGEVEEEVRAAVSPHGADLLAKWEKKKK